MYTLRWEAIFRKENTRTEFIAVDLYVSVPDFSVGRAVIASIMRIYKQLGYELSEIVYKSFQEVKYGKETRCGY